MGIRKSLEGQFEKQEELKLQDFVTPEEKPKDELGFDVEEEITPKIWREMKDELRFFLAAKQYDCFLYLLSDMIIFKPENKMELITEFNVDTLWQEIQNSLKSSDNYYQLEMAKSMVIVHPEKKDEIAFYLNWQSFFDANLFSDYDDPKVLTEKVNRFFALFLIKPDKKSLVLIDEKIWGKLIGYLEKERNSNWDNYANLAKSLLFFCPDKKEDLNLDLQAWRGMKQKLKEKESMDWKIAYASLTANLHMLMANRIEVNDQGIELIMPEKRHFRLEKRHQRPERRNF